MRLFVFVFILAVIHLSCKKDNGQPGEKLEIYLLKSYQLVAGKCQVAPNSAVMQNTSIVKNEDIIEYVKAEYQFTLSATAAQRIKALNNDGAAFAVTIDRKVIYYGIYKPYYSSSSCANSIIMSYPMSDNKITMSLGYAGTDNNINDQRNNPGIIATLTKQGKLR